MKVEEIKLAFETNVKFALIDDIKKEYSKGQIITEEADLNDVVRNLKTKKGLTESVLPICAKAIQMAKELGAEQQLKIATEWEQSAKDRIKKIDNIISKIGSI
jgi:hypothetical protein